MNGNPWSEAELDMLTFLCGELPSEMLLDEYNKWAKRNKYPKRSLFSIRTKANRLGLGTESKGEYLTARTASNLLGCKSDTIANWVRRGWLPGLKYGSNRNARVWVRRTDLRELAKRKPEYFNGYPYRGLMYLLEDEALVEHITSFKWKRSYGRARPVVMLSTGRRFRSMKEAARVLGVGKSNLRESVIRGWTCAGSKWTFARES